MQVFSVRRVLWAASLLLAATMLLVLVQIHMSILRTALSFAGARLDVPLILAFDDSCNGPLAVPPAFDTERLVHPAKFCPGPARMIATQPRGQHVLLFVNGVFVEDRVGNGPTSTFDVLLRPGPNQISVRPKDGFLAFPYASRGMPADIDGAGAFGLFTTILGYVRRPPVPATLNVSAIPKPDPTVRLIGTIGSGNAALQILQGLPDQEEVHIGQASGTQRAVIGPDGFGLMPGVIAANPAPISAIWRHLTIRRSESGEVTVTMQACLPADNALVAWARLGSMETPEMVARMTGVQIGTWIGLADPIWKQHRRIKVTEPAQPGACTQLAGTYAVPQGEIFSHGGTAFPMLPEDSLTIEGFGGLLRVAGRPADTAVEGGSAWHGSAQPENLGEMRLYSQAPDAEPASLSAQGQVQPQAAPNNGLFQAWRSMPEALPSLVRAILLGLAAASPAGLVCWALGRHRPHSPDPGRIDRAQAGVIALLAFMLALAVQPLLLELEHWTIAAFGLRELVDDEARQSRFDIDFYAPIAFLVVIMMVPLLRLYQTPHPQGPRRITGVLAALASFVLLGVAILAAYAERMVIWPQTIESLDLKWINSLGETVLGLDLTPSQAALLALVLAWLAVALLFTWLPVYWLFRTVMPQGRLMRSSLLASFLVFFVPLFPQAADAARVFLAVLWGLFMPHYGENPIGFLLGAIGPPSVVVIVVALLLRGYREIGASMLRAGEVPAFYRRSRFAVLFPLAILIVGPSLSGLGRDPDLASLSIFSFMTLFQGYGTVLSLFAVCAALQCLDESRRQQPFEQRFQLDDSTLILVQAAFAGYLTLWLHEPVSVLVLIGSGWLLFGFLLVGAGDVASEPQAGLAARILAFRSESDLLSKRLKSLEDKFTKGKVTQDALRNQRAVVAAMAATAQTTLGNDVEAARKILFGAGPGGSPWKNGVLGAASGLAAAGLLQLVLPLDLTLHISGKAATWLTLMQAVIVDPSYRLVDQQQSIGGVMSVLNELINAVGIWVIAGFLFGYVFHRIRGNDGFMRAIVFCALVGVPFLLGQDLGATLIHPSAAAFSRLFPLFLFLLVLGSIVFDGLTLRRQGVALAKLPEIYGLRTSLGYASFAGALAGLQPALELLDWVSGK